MLEIFHRLQKNVFLLTLGSAVFLGFSLAYLLTNFVPLFVNTNTLRALMPGTDRRAPEVDVSRPFSDFEGIITGAFIRDSGSSSEKSATGEPGDGEIMLMGLVSGAPEYARASLQIVGKPEIETYRLGETVAGFKINQILGNSIIVERGSNAIRIYVGEKSGEAAATAPAASGNAPTPAGAQKINISRDRLLAATKNMEALYQNKFAPVTRDGKVLGFKLLFVPPGNFLHELGARSGDIIRRFNGEPLENQDKMISMWQSLQNANKISIEVERGGKVIPFEIVIQ